MKIVRDGKEIELTSDELFNAYLEQESLFDLQNISENMGTYLDENEYKLLKDNQEFIEDAAYELRHNQDKHDMDYESAISKAFRDVKKKYLNEISVPLDDMVNEAKEKLEKEKSFEETEREPEI